jgi:hypothetical protein
LTLAHFPNLFKNRPIGLKYRTDVLICQGIF